MKKIYCILFLMTQTGCFNQYLSIKPDKQLVVPSTLQDFQALLDNTDVMNLEMPYLGELGSDDYYMPQDLWNSLSFLTEKNAHVWSRDIYEGSPNVQDWDNRYRQIFYTNNILEGLAGYEESREHREIKGAALFFRGYSFFQLSQIFCVPYERRNAALELGLPLRLDADIHKISRRSTLGETYQQILNDLIAAADMLGDETFYKTRPTRYAAEALLARVYLNMGDYEKALLHAQVVLKEGKASLIDLNNIPSATFPMQRYNQEVIFHSTMATGSVLLQSRMHVDTSLFASYSEQDNRRRLWFMELPAQILFKGSYDGSAQLFNGISLSEMYLIQSECFLRLDRIAEAIESLNTFLSKRYSEEQNISSTYEELLDMILAERRKELPFRGLRWSDLRRLNLDSATEKTLWRQLNGKVYKLNPRSPNYVLPIHNDVIELTGMEQNIRE